MNKTYLLLFMAALLLAAGCASRPLKCNIHVIELMDKRGIHLPNTNANNLDNYLRKSPDWQRIPKLKNGKLNHQAAYKAARSRKAVLLAYHSGSGKSGHIVMVYKKKKPIWSNNFKAKVPYVSGSVQGRKAKITPLSNQFSPDKEPRMNYYMYKK